MTRDAESVWSRGQIRSRLSPILTVVKNASVFNFELTAFAMKIWANSNFSPESTRESPGVQKSFGTNESVSLIFKSVQGPGFIRWARRRSQTVPQTPERSILQPFKGTSMQSQWSGRWRSIFNILSISFSKYFFFLQFQYTFSCFQFLNLVRAQPILDFWREILTSLSSPTPNAFRRWPFVKAYFTSLNQTYFWNKKQFTAVLTAFDKGMLVLLGQCMASCVVGEVSSKCCHRIVESFPNDTKYGSTDIWKVVVQFGELQNFVVLKLEKFKVLHR